MADDVSYAMANDIINSISSVPTRGAAAAAASDTLLAFDSVGGSGDQLWSNTDILGSSSSNSVEDLYDASGFAVLWSTDNNNNNNFTYNTTELIVATANGVLLRTLAPLYNATITTTMMTPTSVDDSVIIGASEVDENNYWGFLAILLVIATAAGNILVCLAIWFERRLQNVTNYFLMSLAITDLMVAVLVMPLGIMTLVKGYFPLGSLCCLIWICLDVLFCTASIMHLCTISVDRFFSLAFPMRFGRNKTNKRVLLKIGIVWLLSLSTSVPLCLMYLKNQASVLVNGTCQIPDPVYKLVGSIVCFYIPLFVMLLSYCLTIRLLMKQSRNLGGINQPQTPGWGSIWLGQSSAIERRRTWRQILRPNFTTTAQAQSINSTDTELSTLDTHELWMVDSNCAPEPRSTTMTALQQFGAEMLKLSRGLESVASSSTTCSPTKSEFSSLNHFIGNSPQHYVANKQSNQQQRQQQRQHQQQQIVGEHHQIPAAALASVAVDSTLILRSQSLRRSARRGRKRSLSPSYIPQRSNVHCKNRRRYSMAIQGGQELCIDTPPLHKRNRFNSLPKNALLYLACQSNQTTSNTNLSTSPSKGHSDSEVEQSSRMQGQHIKGEKHMDADYLQLPPVCTCPYFGDRPLKNCVKPAEVKIISTTFKVTNEMEIDNLLKPPDEELSSILVTTNASGTATISRLSPNSASYMNNNNKGSSLTVHSSEGSSSTGCYLSAPAPTGTPCPGRRKLSISKTASVVTWDSSNHRRRGSSFGSARTTLLLTPTKIGTVLTSSSSATPLRHSATLRSHNNMNSHHAAGRGDSTGNIDELNKLRPRLRTPHSSPCLLQRNQTTSHHSRNSSVISRDSSRHGRNIKLEQKATKVLGVVFFTFVILWSPFFVLNLMPTICGDCENHIAHWVFDVVTWLGYASSMVNPIFYTIFNELFRKTFKKVILCKYCSSAKGHTNR
ncbi:dopamine receptor 2 [Eurosta solidaginis]|uniref:dopamine receptor 2 n=1 Tax=Eurosta solidaginis TaxID=178769 RepID=UPI003530E1CF